jgi:hypothetical protein
MLKAGWIVLQSGCREHVMHGWQEDTVNPALSLAIGEIIGLSAGLVLVGPQPGKEEKDREVIVASDAPQVYVRHAVKGLALWVATESWNTQREVNRSGKIVDKLRVKVYSQPIPREGQAGCKSQDTVNVKGGICCRVPSLRAWDAQIST